MVSRATGAPQAGPDPCSLLTTAAVAAAVGEAVTSSGVNLPAGIGGRQCSWTGADARAVVLETRVDADLDPVLVADHETAVSVLQESIATEAGTLTPIAGLGTVAFIGHGHVYVAAAGGTLVLDDEAGLDQQAEVALARSATDRL